MDGWDCGLMACGVESMDAKKPDGDNFREFEIGRRSL